MKEMLSFAFESWTQALASRKTGRMFFSRLSLNWTARRRASTAELVSDWPSPNSWLKLMGGKIGLESEVGQRVHILVHCCI